MWSLIAALLVGLLVTEINAWLSRLARWLVRRHATRIKDPKLGEVLREQWEADLSDFSGAISKLIFALPLFIVVRRVDREFVHALDVDDLLAQLRADREHSLRSPAVAVRAMLQRHPSWIAEITATGARVQTDDGNGSEMTALELRAIEDWIAVHSHKCLSRVSFLRDESHRDRRRNNEVGQRADASI